MNDLLEIGKREQGQCCCRVPFELHEIQVAVVHDIGRKTRSPDCSSNGSFKFIVAKSIGIGERRRWHFGVRRKLFLEVAQCPWVMGGEGLFLLERRS